MIGHRRCECLGEEFFSGQQCQMIEEKYRQLRILSISSASISIVVIVSLIVFVLMMDVLKYVFGIDPIKEEIPRIRKEKRRHQIHRVFYVHYSDTIIPIQRQTNV